MVFERNDGGNRQDKTLEEGGTDCRKRNTSWRGFQETVKQKSVETKGCDQECWKGLSKELNALR